MSGYTDCHCCGAVLMGEDWETLCDCCHAAGCDPSGEERCEVPECFDCDDHGEGNCNGDGVRASWMNDERWHANCDEPCPNAGKSWDDPEAKARFAKPQPKPQRVFRVPATWQRMSRIAESLRHAVHERRWDETSAKLVPCPPYLAHHEHGYPVFYFGHTLAGTYTRFESARVLCPDCASKAEYDDERIVEQHPNWEDPELYCEECNERIESAYAEEEYEARNILAKCEDGDELTSDELATARAYTEEYVNSINEDTIKGLRRTVGHMPGPLTKEEENDEVG